MSSEDPLERLVSDESFDREKLAESLEKYMFIEGDTNETIFKKNIHQMTIQEKIVLYLLTQKVRYELGYENSEAASPSRISNEMDLNPNTVRSTISRGIAPVYKKTESGNYRVPNHKVEEALDMLD